MTDKPTPTDAELKALWRIHAADIGGSIYYARAVLAKWGQPAGATEEVENLRKALVYAAFALHGTPQYMLAQGIALIGGDTVRVSRDGWTVEASGNPYRQPTPAQAAESVPAVKREQERIAFKDAHRHLELYEVPDAWGRPMFKHSHVEASWLGWIARVSHGQALRLLTQKEKDSLGRRAEGMDGNEWDQWVQEKFAQVNGLKVQGGSYEWDWE